MVKKYIHAVGACSMGCVAPLPITWLPLHLGIKADRINFILSPSILFTIFFLSISVFIEKYGNGTGTRTIFIGIFPIKHAGCKFATNLCV
jgi:hypothetical protein